MRSKEMLPKLKISVFLLERLERVKQQCSGCLFGVFYGDSTLLLMGFNVESTIGKLNYEQIQHQFPAELDLCGLVKFGDCSDAEAHISEILKDVDITDNPILLQCELGTLVGLHASIFMHGKLQEVPYEKFEAAQLHRDFCFTRLKCSLSIYTEETPQAVRHNMHSLRKMLSGGSLAFTVEPTKIFITNALTHGSSSAIAPQGISNNSLISDIVRAVRDANDSANDRSENNAVAKKKLSSVDHGLSRIYGALGCNYDILNIGVLRCKTRERSVSDSNSALRSVSVCVERDERKVYIPLEVDTMAMLGKETAVTRLYDILIESICRSLRLFEHSINEHLEKSESAKLMIPHNYHFFPQEFGHFLSCSYLADLSDDDSIMQDKRKRLHRHFGLAVTRPYFRRTNSCIFRTELANDSPLVNPHLDLRTSGIQDGKQYLVQGNYYYYHYLQQQIQDKGWGCAYRSLQTLCSWFLLQGYTKRAIPTHKEIQQYLVRIGDKPQSFVESTQWIGSTEVSMCLQGFLNVDSKIQHVASGSDMATISSDLAMHFQTQGTPIMIGGGVLAHTIIGIDYCAQTRELKFLVLDPHYTGADDLQTVLAKGWCGWKGVDFWDKKSYYNLCMPQRPVVF